MSEINAHTNTDRPDTEQADDKVKAMEGDRTEAMDALVAGCRIQKGTVMEDDRMLTDHERQAIVSRFKSYKAACERNGVDLPTLRNVAKAIACSPATLSQVLGGKYPEGKTGAGTQQIDNILRSLDRWLSQQEAQKEAPKRSGFVWTGVANEIRAVADTAVLLKTMSVVYGPAGIGKTPCLEALKPMFPGAAIVTISDSARSVTQFFGELAIELKADRAGHCATKRRLVCDCLKGSGRLVMVDEAHLASAAVLNAIRQVHDVCENPILLVGLPKLARMLVRGREDDSMGATLYSRIGINRDLTERCRQDDGRGEPLYSVEDIQQVFAKSSLRLTRDALDWLVSLANMPEVGGLRAANSALRLATHVAQKGGKKTDEITARMLLQAARLLLGTEAAKQLTNRIEQKQKVA